MNLIFLGNSGGIQGANGGNTSLVVSQENSATVMVDVSGSPCEGLIKSGIDPLSLDVLLLTHGHIDHIYALPSLIHNLWLMGRSRELLIVSAADTLAMARQLVDLFSLENKKGMFPIRMEALRKDDMFVGGLRIIGFPVNHIVPAVGFVFEFQGKKLVYSGDCNFSTSFPDEAENCNVLVHEACVGGKADHSSGLEAGEKASMLNAEKLFLVHLPQDDRKREEILSQAKEKFPKTGIPRICWRYEV